MMNLSRRGFLKLLSALPAAVVVAQLPALAQPPLERVLEALPDVDPVLLDAHRAASSGIYLEIAGKRLALDSLSLDRQVDTIDLTSMPSHQKSYIRGMTREALLATTSDCNALFLLSDVFYATRPVDMRAIVVTPELEQQEFITDVRGMLSSVSEEFTNITNRFVVHFRAELFARNLGALR